MNLISSLDLDLPKIRKIFSIADSFGTVRAIKMPCAGKIMSLLFEKPSTRTRVSFEAAMSQLGGSSIYIDSSTSQLSRGETLQDTARVLSSYVDVISARMYLDTDIRELAAGASVPVINALTDLEHPCQALSDVYTIEKSLGNLKGLRIAFVGDIAANTANSLMVTASILGAELSLIGPTGYSPNTRYVEAASRHSMVEITNDLKTGLSGCSVIYTDTFISMGQEKQAAQRRKTFSGYQVNSKVLGYAKKGAKVMHCLPAHRGEEITSDVLDGRSSLAWEQAANKLPIEKAILLYLLSEAK